MSATSSLLIDVEAAARLLLVTPRQLSRLARQGRIPHIDLGDGELRFDPDALRRWVASQSSEGATANV